MNEAARLTQRALLSAAEIQQLIKLGETLARRPPARSPAPRVGRIGARSGAGAGRGMDYAETRPYQPGDEVRHFNWRAMARSGQAQVRVFHPERCPPMCVVIDRGPSMRFGSRTRLKVAQAARVALVLAGQATARSAEVGLLSIEGSPHWHPPASGSPALARFIDTINAPAPPLDLSPVDWPQTLGLLRQQLPAGSVLWLLSDFRGLDDAQLGLLGALARQCSVRGILIEDPLESGLPKGLGPTWLHWHDQRRLCDGTDAERDRRWAFGKEQRLALLRRSGVPVESLSTTTDTLGDLL